MESQFKTPNTSTSIDPKTQGYIDGVVDAKKAELKEELSTEVRNQGKAIADEIKQDLQNFVATNQTRVIEALAVFVALFTFIAINIQIFRGVTDLKTAAVFMVLMAFLSLVIVSFPIILMRASKNDKPPRWVWLVFGTSIALLIIAGLVSLFFNLPLNPPMAVPAT